MLWHLVLQRQGLRGTELDLMEAVGGAESAVVVVGGAESAIVVVGGAESTVEVEGTESPVEVEGAAPVVEDDVGVYFLF